MKYKQYSLEDKITYYRRKIYDLQERTRQASNRLGELEADQARLWARELRERRLKEMKEEEEKQKKEKGA